VEYKHYLNQHSVDGTLIIKEFPSSEGEPFYPVPNAENQALFEKYRQIVNDFALKNNVHFIGRLASYKYLNMDQAIEAALDYFAGFKQQLLSK
jgi:UDP-galactopyranose mutase